MSGTNSILTLARSCLLLLTIGVANLAQACVTADVVAIDQVFYYNRLGAMNPSGMIYALKRDVVSSTSGSEPAPGNARLRSDKRPRPLVLRVNEGDCLTVNFTNLLNPVVPTPVAPHAPEVVGAVEPVVPEPAGAENSGPATRHASFHVMGMQASDIISDASNVGNNVSG